MPQKMALAEDLFILLENTKTHDDVVRGYLYDRPVSIITTSDPKQVTGCLADIDLQTSRGFHVAGWMAYEAGFSLEPGLEHLAPSPDTMTLLWFGVFQKRRSMRQSDLLQFWQDRQHPSGSRHAISAITPSVSRDQYTSCIEKIHEYLAAGDTYQINYTLRNRFDFTGDAESLYGALRAAQPVEFGAYIQTPDQTIMSFSPELFVKKVGIKLTSKPMKGTAARGNSLQDDLKNRTALMEDEKSRAENLMIVDLIRNDLSRVASQGSVMTPRLFEVEPYRTILQMTSTVEAEIDPATSLVDIFKALYPCGSITGAPKIRAMEIINELEAGPRGIYTGAIGYVTPERDFCFNVPIRTITLNSPLNNTGSGTGQFGSGGGIIADSHADAEYHECLLKARFLTDPHPSFDLIETMLFRHDAPTGDQILYLDEHLDRLEASAKFFDFHYREDTIRNHLVHHALNLTARSDYRMRLLLGCEGTFSITSIPMPAPEKSRSKPFAVVAPSKVNSQDPLLYHKTTRRELYENTLALQAAETGCCEVIFMNERNELTEGARTNLFVELNGQLTTPPVTCGLLPGILRQHLLDNGRVIEQAVTLPDLQKADKIYIGNSVRGLTEVILSS